MKYLFILIFFISFIIIFTSNNIKQPIVESIRDEEVDLSHRTDSLSMLILTCLLIISVLLTWLFRLRNFQFMHETGLSMILGIVAGGIIRIALYLLTINESTPFDVVTVHLKNGHNLMLAPNKLLMNISNNEYIYTLSGRASPQGPKLEDIEQIEEKSSFNPEIFFYVLLPPIVFFAGYQLHRDFFFRNIGAILTLAFIGTLISCFAISGLTFLYANYINKIDGYTLSEGMIFGSIISATDPVTVLSIFEHLKVDVDLHALVFGESVFNDAVAIVLYRTIQSFMTFNINQKEKNINFMTIFDSIYEFIRVFLGSLCIGVTIAIVTAIVTKSTKIGKFPVLEISFVILMSYTTFLLAEVAQWSGIVSVLFCGITQKHYTYFNLSSSSALRIVQVLELINFINETFIFSYIGLSTFLFTDHCWNWGFILWALLSTQISRIMHIYPLCALLNINKKPKIPCSHQHALTWSGLRGAMAFALAIRNTSTPVRKLMLTSTLSCVIFSVIVQGGLTQFIISLLKIKTGVIHDTENEEEEKLYAISDILNNPHLDEETMKSILSHRFGIIEENIETLLRDQIYKSEQTPRDVILESIEGKSTQVHKQSKFVKLFQNIDKNYFKPFFINKKYNLNLK